MKNHTKHLTLRLQFKSRPALTKYQIRLKFTYHTNVC